MKLSKSKLALAKVINENGGWVDDSANWAVQPKHGDGDIWFSNCDNKPYRNEGRNGFAFDGRGLWLDDVIKHNNLHQNWHQCVLSREEYYQAYPKADADGWIEWKGGECPITSNELADIKWSDGFECVAAKPISFRWSFIDGFSNIIAYRLHKPEVKPEFCESVTHDIPEPESIDGLLAKVTEENKHQHADAKPTIEQLAQDYRNKLDFAKRKQQEADDAKADADERLKTLELAGEAIGLLVSPITAKQWPELVIAVQVGDEVECIKSNVNPGKYMGRIGTVSSVDVDDTSTPYLVDFDGEAKIWCHEVKFIRRP